MGNCKNCHRKIPDKYSYCLNCRKKPIALAGKKTSDSVGLAIGLMLILAAKIIWSFIYHIYLGIKWCLTESEKKFYQYEGYKEFIESVSHYFKKLPFYKQIFFVIVVGNFLVFLFIFVLLISSLYTAFESKTLISILVAIIFILIFIFVVGVTILVTSLKRMVNSPHKIIFADIILPDRPMSYQEYKNYLESPHWQKLKREKLNFVDYQCERCKVSGVSLEVHHLHYDSLGNEALEDLLVVCKKCHLELELKKEMQKN